MKAYFIRIVSFSAMLLAVNAAATGDEETAARPNFLWITCEDISQNLGCYGDSYAVTPNLDRLAAQGVRYRNAFAPIGVCAPARSTLIAAMWANSIGSQLMRCEGMLPAAARFYPEYLRDAGYYCTNNSKTDYNLPMRSGAWDESSARAHWRKRRDKSQPFFAIFNLTTSHESQIRLGEKQYRERVKDFKPEEIHDPAKAPIPPYHPDAPEVRQDWARYADMITYMDRQAGEILRELEEDGLSEDTIVFFYSDHGAGMPRSKRWLYDSSLRVPLIVRFPEKYKRLAPGEPGSAIDRLVSFVDFPPTLLSLAGVKVPEHFQGMAFLGGQAAAPRRYIYGFRDRMDERYDLLRCARDERYKYIRNFMPQLPWFHHQYISYMYDMPTMRAWQRLADEGKLSGPEAIFMAPRKPIEELYDTRADPNEIRNLAADPAHREALERLRAECRRWMLEISDLGLLPENDLRARFGDAPPYDAVRRDPSKYPIDRILAAADLANRIDPEALPRLIALLDDGDPAVRYWGAVGINALGAAAGAAAAEILAKVGGQPPAARLQLAEALANLGHLDRALPILGAGLAGENEWVRLQAANAIDRLDERARPLLDQIRGSRDDRSQYVRRVIDHTLEGFPK